MKRIKVLKVIGVPQNGKYVPGIRVAGKWLLDFNFYLGDKVWLTARKNKIVIEKMKGDEKQ